MVSAKHSQGFERQKHRFESLLTDKTTVNDTNKITEEALTAFGGAMRGIPLDPGGPPASADDDDHVEDGDGVHVVVPAAHHHDAVGDDAYITGRKPDMYVCTYVCMCSRMYVCFLACLFVCLLACLYKYVSCVPTPSI